MDIQSEYDRIRENLQGTDDATLKLVDGLLWEAAKIRVQLDELNTIASVSGLVAVNPKNPTQQRELPVSKLLTKQRANYLNYIAKIASICGTELEEEEDFLSEFE